MTLPGSAKAAPSANTIGTLNPGDMIGVTVTARRKRSVGSALASLRRYSRDEYEERFGASPVDVAKVEEFAHRNHLSTAEVNLAGRTVQLRGAIKDFEEAFHVHLSHYRDAAGAVFRGRTGEVNVPRSLGGIILGVFGLDNRPHAVPKFQVATKDGLFIPHAAAPSSFFADTLSRLYGFPTGGTGKGQCIGIIELGGGYRVKDLETYFSLVGLRTPSVTAISVDGGINSPSTPDSADGEVMLDIEVAGAVAPGAKIVVYFSTNTDKGFLDAVTTAVHDNRNSPAVISISWGQAEANWTVQSLNAFDEAFKAASLIGVTVCIAAGDRGSSDGLQDGKVHVDFPAASPFVLACGGTKVTAKGGKIISEVVWHESDSSATGGGVSNFFPLPFYQRKGGVPPSLDAGFKGRGVPDVAADADPDTGYKVIVDGQEMVIGGTSAVAPLMAGLSARVNQSTRKNAGFVNHILYSHPSLCRDITQGNNITTSTNEGYSARKGWDACTGLGVPSTFIPK